MNPATLRLTLGGHPPCAVASVAVSPDGTHVAAGAAGQSVRVYTVAPAGATESSPMTATAVCETMRLEDRSDVVAWTKDSSAVLRVAPVLWQLHSPTDNSELDGVAEACCSTTGASIGPGPRPYGEPGPVGIFSVTTASPTWKGLTLLRLASAPRLAAGAAPTAEYGVSCGIDEEHQIKLCDAEIRESGSEHDLGDADRHSDTVNTVTISLDGLHLASCSDDATVKVWDLGTDTCTATLAGHSGAVLAAAFFPDGTRLVSAGVDGVKIWDLASRACVQTIQNASGTSAVAVFPSGNRFVSGTCDGTIEVWDVLHFRRVAHCLIRQRVAASPLAVPAADVPERERLLHLFVYGIHHHAAEAGRVATAPLELFQLVIALLVG